MAQGGSLLVDPWAYLPRRAPRHRGEGRAGGPDGPYLSGGPGGSLVDAAVARNASAEAEAEAAEAQGEESGGQEDDQ